MIDIGESFDKTLDRFGISAAWLSRESGVNQQMISRFRNGKEIQTDTLEKLLAVLPGEVRNYFFSLLLGRSLSINITEIVSEMDEQELKEVLFTIARRISGRTENRSVA